MMDLGFCSKILQSSIADVSRHVQELTEAEHDLERQLEDHVLSVISYLQTLSDL